METLWSNTATSHRGQTHAVFILGESRDDKFKLEALLNVSGELQNLVFLQQRAAPLGARPARHRRADDVAAPPVVRPAVRTRAADRLPRLRRQREKRSSVCRAASWTSDSSSDFTQQTSLMSHYSWNKRRVRLNLMNYEQQRWCQSLVKKMSSAHCITLDLWGHSVWTAVWILQLWEGNKFWEASATFDL